MASGTLNKVMLIGHTGDDVKMHYFENGGCIGRFPLATNDSYVNKSTGEKVTTTEWHNIVVRNKAAEVCEKYLKKGDKVYIEGSIRNRKWTDDQNNERYSIEIHCNEFTFLTPKNEHSGSGQAANYSQNQNSNQNPSNKQKSDINPGLNDEEDDLPF